jgi:predicted acylesterase/phospholipase RssA
MANGTRDLGLCLAGGGNRAFWQLGFLSRVGDQIFPRLSAMSGASAGACASVVLVAGRTQEARTSFARLRKGILSNFDAKKLLVRERPLPHEGVYRSMLRDCLDDGAMQSIKNAPHPILILGAEPRLPLFASLAVGLAAYQLEKIARPSVLHPTLAPRLGFNAHVHDARACTSADDVTPPFTKEGRYRGARLLDGSLVDNAPAYTLDVHAKKTIVLLTRPYPKGALGVRNGRLYLAPTEPVPAHRWDYRESAPVDETIALGERDAERHADALAKYLAT